MTDDLSGAAHDGRENVDLSVQTARTSAAPESSSIPEHELIQGYGTCPECGSYPCDCVAIRREPCACGLVIRAQFNNWPAARRAVEEHNASKPHRAWRHWRDELDRVA